MFSSLAVLAAITAAIATPLHMQRRSDIDVDKVVGFEQSVPDTLEGALMLKYKPYLHVANGCVPFPAVDAKGNTNGGLKPTGKSSGECGSGTGQVYARAATHNNMYAIVYTWYFPKDIPSWVATLVGVGHRHDWECIVVWLSKHSTDASLLGVAASFHSDYEFSKTPETSDNHPLIEYYSKYGMMDNSLGFTDAVGDMQPLIAWGSMPSVAQQALLGKDWGAANFPFTDSTFHRILERAQPPP